MTIEICHHPKFSGRIDRARLKRIAGKTLRAGKARSALTIYITTDVEIRKLNRQFHATDSATDVLSFPFDRTERSEAASKNYLGDIVISYDSAKRQARDAGWLIADELNLLAVHGILHLIGYDDVTPRKRAVMWQRQREILGRVAGND